MSNINIFKIEMAKEDELNNSLENYNCIAFGSKETKEITYEYELYKSISIEKKAVSWEWVAKEFDEELDKIDTQPNGLLKLTINNTIYVLSFGHAFFLCEKYCDKDYGFNFAKRMRYEEIKTTTLVAPNSKRNKTVNVYTDNDELDFDSGESFVKIKIKVDDPILSKYIKPTIEIGSSIKCRLNKDKISSVVELILEIEKVLKQDVVNKIPLFNKIKDKGLIDKLEAKLIDKLNIDQLEISFSELDIIGAIEIFNTNYDSYELKYNRNKKSLTELNDLDIKAFVEEYSIKKEEILNIKVICHIDDKEYIRKLHDIIDYTDDVEKCILCNGVWYKYNDDYIQFVDESLKGINCIYDPKYDFTDDDYDKYFNKRSLKDPTLTKMKFYRERAFNELREEQDGFKNYDRSYEMIKNYKIEMMDLYKDKTMYAVKIGDSSAKLCYVVDQSLLALKMLKNNKVESPKEIEQIGIWILLDRKKHIEDENNIPNFENLDLLALKSKIADWSRNVLLSGKKPIIRINYTK